MDSVVVASCPACLSMDLFPFSHVTDFRASGEVFELVRCARCELVITQNHPADTGIGPYYETEDYISHSDSGESWMDRIYYTVRKWMVRRKRLLIEKYVRGRTLIDIGAGTGFFLSHMEAHGWQVRGLEPNAQARQVALQSHDLKLEGPETLFDMPAHSADCITMWHVLEHVHAPDKYLDHIYRILKDDGILILALPNYQSLDQHFYKNDWGAWDVPRHLWHFTSNALKLMLGRFGFHLEHKYAMPFDAFYVAFISEKYRGGGIARMMRGIAIAKLTFFNALVNRNSASSLIYVFKKKETKSNNP